MMILHATWSDAMLHLWGESGRAFVTHARAGGLDHPYAAGHDELAGLPGLQGCARTWLTVRLPSRENSPEPSPQLLRHSGIEDDGAAGGLGRWRVPSLQIGPERAERALDGLVESGSAHGAFAVGASVRFFASVAHLARSLTAQQRFVPMLIQTQAMGLEGQWRPWLGDQASSERAVALSRAMPASARAGEASCGHDAWMVTEEALASFVDALCRGALVAEQMAEAIEGSDALADPQVAWLAGLLGPGREVQPGSALRGELVRRARVWIGGLDERGQSAAWRLCIRVEEPRDAVDGGDGTSADWTLRFLLQSTDDPSLSIEAEDIWVLPTDSIALGGRRLESPSELLLSELGRASRIYKKLESALREAQPSSLSLTVAEAYEFLREITPVLAEQSVGVIVPPWWDQPSMRLGVRLRIDAGESPPGEEASLVTGGLSRAVGLEALVGYAWEISVGDRVLSREEFERLSSRRAPLVRLGGRWVEVRPEDLEAAMRLVRDASKGKVTLAEAMRMAYDLHSARGVLHVTGVEASGWISPLFGRGDEVLDVLEPPVSFRGTLRPYQVRGLSWMSFLERFGFGACLADDMGLGKTVQLLALMQSEREGRSSGDAPLGPTLLVVPMSVVGNWVRESGRFAPELRVHVHHGVGRAQGEDLGRAAVESDLVITTYALVHRDREQLGRVGWRRIVLDEAQYIKNPQAKQAQAVRSLSAPRRIALTGTPVENRLAELWSIMDFLNPGYLGSAGAFRRNFALPIERYHDQSRGDQLRSMVRPFVLRRHKSDPAIISDLPEKLETREFCVLTREQAALYQSCVTRVLADVDGAQGMQRRGLVLSALIRLKQICNHPSQAAKDHDFDSPEPPDPSRSGKCVRLMEMLDEVLASGEKALIFTQYRQMGHLLALMLRHEFESDVLFLHGGTAQGQRVAMIDAFQSEGPGNSLMVLSLKAGGVGLNLTAATHVFHFDRWWNPAVENQATDRAYRIGQTKAVQVHKFVVRGTLEERIDEMIESKTELAESIVGSGERWLTELSTEDLRGILSLRDEAVGDEL